MGTARLMPGGRRPRFFAGLDPTPGMGWHSLRRKFASDLMDRPVEVLCELGGWKTAKTVPQCYQRPDAGQLRKGLEDRGRARNGNREQRESGLLNMTNPISARRCES